MAPYALIVIAVLSVFPFAIRLAEKQDKKTKSHLKNILLLLLLGEIILATPNWQLLYLFLAISLLQFILLLKKPSRLVVFLNFINTFILFITMARLSQPIGNLTNLLAIATAFLVLVGNVIGLLLINNEKRLILKPFSRQQKLYFSLALVLAATVIICLSYWNNRTRQTALTRVGNLPEVKEYLSRVPNGLIVIDHEDRDTNSYLIHVYEVVDDHTATFNWYEVNKTTGAIKTEF